MTMQSTSSCELDFNKKNNSTHIQSIIAVALRKIAAYFDARKMRKEDRITIKELSQVDHIMLKDMGLTEADIHWASQLPSNVSATDELNCIRKRK